MYHIFSTVYTDIITITIIIIIIITTIIIIIVVNEKRLTTDLIILSLKLTFFYVDSKLHNLFFGYRN